MTNLKKIIIISVITNILLILIIGYVIHKKGGIEYIKIKLHLKEPGVSVLYEHKTSFYDIMPNDSNEIIFLGNSITDECDWYELFRNANIKNRGIGGDKIDGIINRLDEIVSSNPKKIFLMIGINDLLYKNTVEQILINYERLLILIKEKSPGSKHYIQSILPIYNNGKWKLSNNDIIASNKGIKDLTKKYNLTYVNLFDLFKTEKNELDKMYSIDGMHLNGNGYLLWKKAIEQYVNN